MTVVYKNQQLSVGEISLQLQNAEGQIINVNSVTYSIYALDGKLVSGKSLPAILAVDGKYYIPWESNIPNGTYKILWEINTNGIQIEIKESYIFVLDKAAYPKSPSSVCCILPSSIPNPLSKVFISGTTLGPEDLNMYLNDSITGLFIDPYSIYWTIFNCRGCIETRKTVGSKYAVGKFYAPYTVMGPTAEYDIVWEFKENVNSPLMSKTQRFSVLNTTNLKFKECDC